MTSNGLVDSQIGLMDDILIWKNGSSDVIINDSDFMIEIYLKFKINFDVNLKLIWSEFKATLKWI